MTGFVIPSGSTISVSSGSKDIIVAGADWNLLGITANATLRLLGRNVTIASVPSSGNPQLAQNWPDGNVSGAAYEVYPDLDAYTFSVDSKQFQAFARAMLTSGRYADSTGMVLSPDCFTGIYALATGAVTPPTLPMQYDAYILGASPTGVWTGKGGQIAVFWTGAWRFFTPTNGLIVTVDNPRAMIVYSNGVWTSIGGGVAVSPEMFGNPQTAAATQAAVDFCKAKGGGVVEFNPATSYRWDSGITVDAGYVAIRGNGSVIDCSHMTSGYALTVTSSLNLASDGLRQDAHYIEGLVLSGPGSSSTVYGIAFVGSNTASPNNSPTGIAMRSIHVRYFGRGAEWKTNAYIMSWFGGGIFSCNYGICCFSGASNVGENLNLHGVRITGCLEAIYTEVDTCYFNLTNCSIDYNKRFANAQKGGITMIACHLECAPSNMLNSDGSYQRPLVVGSAQSAYMQIIGGNLHCNNGPPSGLDYVLENDGLSNGSGGFDMDGTQVTFWRTSTAYFATGVGRTNIRNVKTWGGYFNTNSVYLSAQSCSLLYDGGFEATSVLEAYISGVTDASGNQTAVTSRTTMTYASLSTSTDRAHSGSRSLKCYHPGAGRVTNYQIAVPLKDKTGIYGIEWWMLNPNGLTGTIYVTVYWGKRQGSLPVDSGTQAIPVYSKLVVASQQGFAWSGAFTTWAHYSFGNALTYVPPWADTMVIEFASFGLSGTNYYYVDDVVATVM